MQKRKWTLVGAVSVLGIGLVSGGAIAAANAVDINDSRGDDAGVNSIRGTSTGASLGVPSAITPTPSPSSSSNSSSDDSSSSSSNSSGVDSVDSPNTAPSPTTAPSAPSPMSPPSVVSPMSAASVQSPASVD
jgi:hypothetical protein